MLGFSGVFEALILIALGFGYIVLYLAKREEKGLQFVGYVIGGVIIVLAIIYLLCNIWAQASLCYPRLRYRKGIMQQRMIQPRMMQPRMMPQAPAQKP